MSAAVWINTEPIAPAELDGRVVVVEFWTFDCINCKRSVPALRQLHDRYSSDEFALIAVHTPEFGYERDIDNVRRAVKDQAITYPVAIDNDKAIWHAFRNRYWPALYVIDRRGIFRHQHIGELHTDRAHWQELTGIIDQLLAEGA